MYGLEGTDYEPTNEEIREAARLANAASFIEVSGCGAVNCERDVPFVVASVAHRVITLSSPRNCRSDTNRKSESVGYN